jgi:type II secretion system protein G
LKSPGPVSKGKGETFMKRVRTNILTRAFTLVEILIVVVILGILASIVVPQFASATEQAQRSAIVDQIRKLRQAIAVYYVRAGNDYPTITPGDQPANWGEIGPGSTYMRSVPANVWVGGPNSKMIVHGTEADTTFHMDYGWIWDPDSGNLWAAGCDDADNPLPRP